MNDEAVCLFSSEQFNSISRLYKSTQYCQNRSFYWSFWGGVVQIWISLFYFVYSEDCLAFSRSHTHTHTHQRRIDQSILKVTLPSNIDISCGSRDSLKARSQIQHHYKHIRIHLCTFIQQHVQYRHLKWHHETSNKIMSFTAWFMFIIQYEHIKRRVVCWSGTLIIYSSSHLN